MSIIMKFVKSHRKSLILLIAIAMVVVGVRQVGFTNDSTTEETVSETAVSGLEVMQELATTEENMETEAETETALESNVEEASEQPTELVSEQPAEQLSIEELEVRSDAVRESASEVETENTPAPEVLPEPEEMVSTEVVPDTQPEEEVPKEPEKTPEPEAIPEPEEIPEPERIPETEATHEHSWMFESVFQEPTCSNGGLENQICAHCGETRTIGGTPTGEHNYVVENTGDCCSEEIVRCSECNAREVRDKDMNNHIDVEDGICYGCGYSK